VLGALSAFAALLGLGHGLAVSCSLRLAIGTAAALVFYEVATALILSMLILAVARWALRGAGRDAMRMIFGVGLLLIATMASLFRVSSLIGWAALATFVSFRDLRRSFAGRETPSSSTRRVQATEDDALCSR
jgi:hypothetical protein